MRGKKTLCGKVLNRVAHRFCEGLDKGTATRGAGLVKHNTVDRVVAYFKAFNILTADIENKINLRIKVLGGGKMSKGLNETAVGRKCVFNNFLAVAGDGAAL